MKFNKDFHKVKTKSRTAIIFDKNEPIITNYATTRFTPGISIGAKAGYNFYPYLENSKSYFVGATVSPFKSYRFYWQAEFVNSFNSYDNETTIEETLIQDANGIRQEKRVTTETNNTSINWEIPILIRYNINNFVGIGAGIQANLDISSQQDQNQTIETFEGNKDKYTLNTTYEKNSVSNSFSNVKTGLLFDVTAGFARIGPSLGARYVLNFEDDFNYFQLYAIWKF